MKTLRSLCGLWACLVFGCGSNEIPLIAVSGKVTIDGKPLAFKKISFIPQPGTPGMGSGANTNKDGEFKLLAVRPGTTVDVYGVTPGKYKVVVTEPVFPITDIDIVPAATGDGPAPAIGLPVAKPVKKSDAIPARYVKEETTPLLIEVSADTPTINLELTRP
jgi:hypothetical protein